MKAITLTQPWATLVAIEAKLIETRSWSTNYRGEIAIHAAKGLGPVGGMRGLEDLCQTPPFNSVLLEAGIHFAQDLPLGAIVATATLVTVEPTYGGTPERWRKPTMGSWQGEGQHEAAFGDYTYGRYAWILGDVVALSTPLPAKGALGLWEWDAPHEGEEDTPICPECGEPLELAEMDDGEINDTWRWSCWDCDVAYPSSQFPVPPAEEVGE